MAYYVYRHIRLDNDTVFYIGKGKDNRAYSKKRNQHWKNITNKTDYVVDICADCLTEEDAFELEELLILEYGLSNLCNMTLGGEGASGYKHTEEWKSAASKRQRGKSMTQEMLDNLDKARASRKFNYGYKISKSLTGKKQSNETKAKRSESLKKAYTNGVRLKPNFVGNTNTRNKNKYLFKHKDGTSEHCTPYELYTKYNINVCNVNRVVRGERVSVNGWKLIIGGVSSQL